jgi:glycyl-tRNA synthetase alpha subunit
MNEEIKIITLGDIFKNIETEEKAFKFKDYIKDLQQKVEQLETIRKEAIEIINQYIPNYASCVKAFDELENILNKGSNKDE